MKTIWCPETATKAYVDTVKSCGMCTEDSGASEFISATAGGWKAKLIVEVRSSSNIGGAAVGNSVGLAIAAHHSGGRHVCILGNEKAGKEYIWSMQISTAAGCAAYSLPEVMVGEAEELMERLNGIDFLVVDGGSDEDCGRIIKHAKFSHLGAVIVCRNAAAGGRNKKRALPSASASGVVRALRWRFLPIGNGLDVAYVGGEKVEGFWKSGPKPKAANWIRHIDQESGEEHLFRR